MDMGWHARLTMTGELSFWFYIEMVTHTGFSVGRASWPLSRGCTGSCPGCCLWSETPSQTCAMETNSCCCSGCCWPRCHPARSRHHLWTRSLTIKRLCKVGFTIVMLVFKELLPFLSLLKVTTLGWLMEISMSGGLISAIFISSSSSDSSSES